mmetsp:Transcript_16560/g.30668  ORF Transcript_16560/g.30668 Transcript_16560/m.30668 type:complete len:494 (+) Transcript_16560:90-1571(+)
MPLCRPRSAPTRTGVRRGRRPGSSQNVRFTSDDLSFLPRAEGRGMSPDSEDDEEEVPSWPSNTMLSGFADMSGFAHAEEDDSTVDSKWWHVSDKRIQELVKCMSQKPKGKPVVDTISDSLLSETQPLVVASSSVAGTTGAMPSAMSTVPCCPCRGMVSAGRLRRDPLADWPPDQASKLQDATQSLGATWPLDASAQLNLSFKSLPGAGNKTATSLASSAKTLAPDYSLMKESPFLRRPLHHNDLLEQLHEDLELQRQEREDLTQLPAGRSPSSRRVHGQVGLKDLARRLPMPCPTTGRRHGGLLRSDELIDIDLYFHKDSDRVTIRLHPDTRIGPDQLSLKGLIFEMTGIEPSAQRLKCRNFDVSMDKMTLRAYGISQGQTVIVHHKVRRARGRKHPSLLACTAKKVENQERREQHLQRMAAAVQEQPDAWLMPKWLMQPKPKDCLTGMPPRDPRDFEAYDDLHQDMQVEPRLLDFRSGQAYTQQMQFDEFDT